MTATRIARLRWRAPWWSPSTATRVTIYARPSDAWAARDRFEAKGYKAEVSIADRTAWRMVRPGPWSTGPVADAWREAGL
jgi:hypothetical protein